MTTRILIGAQIAWSLEQGGPAPAGSPGDLFLVTDASRLTPLPLHNLQGQAVAKAVTTTTSHVPQLLVDVPDGTVQVVWVSGQWETIVMSLQAVYDLGQSQLAAAVAAGTDAAAAAAAAQSLAASSALPGGGTEGQALMRRAAGALGWGDVASTAARVSFVPTGSVTAANVQGAIEQLVTLGVGSGAVLVIRWTTAGWPAFPTVKPAASLVLLVGPSTAPAPGAAPSWAGWDAAQVPVLTFLGA